MLGASQVALRGAAAAAVTHDSLVAIFGPDVVSYWKFENNGSDERSTQDATVTGSPELNVNTIVDLDTIAEGAPGDGKCIAWPGSGGVFAEAAHNAAHKTAQGAIAITFQRDTADQKSVLVAADASAAAGGLSVEVTPSGQPRAFLRRQSDGAPVILTGQAGDVQLDEAYTLIFKWGSEGLSLALWDADGTLVRRLTAPLTDGVTGTSPIRFGAWHTGVDQHDGPYGRVIWLQRRISDSEEQVLARARTIGRPDPGNIALIGAWPMSEPSGNTFADTVGGNTATLAVPSWTFATHENNRPGIVAGSDHALEVSNGGPAIPMAAGYKQAEMSLVLYVEPRGELRGCQYWNESDERFGRELLAYCDNGSTPGSFAIYRRRNGVAGLLGLSGTPQWRLGGYVRDSSGTKVYFGGGVSGISAAVLPVDTAKRIVLTQGLNGARLYLDDSEVASLPSVTQGWASLTAPISLGSSSTTGHANDRSPFWGRLDQVEVWQGQMALAEVQARPAAVQSTFYRVPTDGPLVNITSHGGNIQAAMDAAHAVGGYVFQEASNVTWNVIGINETIGQRAGCRGMVGVRLRRPSSQNQSGRRMFRLGTTGDGGLLPSGHGDPFAASGGFKYIGCKWDGNARGQSWAPTAGQASADGKANDGFDFQFAHCFQSNSPDTRVTYTMDACEFFDNTGDAISISDGSTPTVKSCRFYGTYRGPIVTNDLRKHHITARRNEMHVRGNFSGSYANMGCGMCDIEPFGGGNSEYIQLQFFDCWAEGDWDDKNRELNGATTHSFSKWYNCHTTCAPPVIQPTWALPSEGVATPEVLFQRCTISYYKRGYRTNGTTSGNFPPSMLRGFVPGPSGTGALFEECVFIANGRPFNYHEFGLADPAVDSSPSCTIIYELGDGLTGKLMTLRNCQFRVTRLPSGITLANTRAIAYPSGMGTGRQIELDGVTIDAAFADEPFAMGGATVRHRNVVHERTLDTTPWTGAGAEVAI